MASSSKKLLSLIGAAIISGQSVEDISCADSDNCYLYDARCDNWSKLCKCDFFRSYYLVTLAEPVELRGNQFTQVCQELSETEGNFMISFIRIKSDTIYRTV